MVEAAANAPPAAPTPEAEIQILLMPGNRVHVGGRIRNKTQALRMLAQAILATLDDAEPAKPTLFVARGSLPK